MKRTFLVGIVSFSFLIITVSASEQVELKDEQAQAQQSDPISQIQQDRVIKRNIRLMQKGLNNKRDDDKQIEKHLKESGVWKSFERFFERHFGPMA